VQESSYVKVSETVMVELVEVQNVYLLPPSLY
jgi:hypothetical protein